MTKHRLVTTFYTGSNRLVVEINDVVLERWIRILNHPMPIGTPGHPAGRIDWFPAVLETPEGDQKVFVEVLFCVRGVFFCVNQTHDTRPISIQSMGIRKL